MPVCATTDAVRPVCPVVTGDVAVMTGVAGAATTVTAFVAELEPLPFEPVQTRVTVPTTAGVYVIDVVPLATVFATVTPLAVHAYVMPLAAGDDAVNASPTVAFVGAVMTGVDGAATDVTVSVATGLVVCAALTSAAVMVIVPTAPAV